MLFFGLAKELVKSQLCFPKRERGSALCFLFPPQRKLSLRETGPGPGVQGFFGSCNTIFEVSFKVGNEE